VTIRTANAGVAGGSGKLVFSTGTSSSGNSGSVNIKSGSATGGRGGPVIIEVGSGNAANGGDMQLTAGSTSSAGSGGKLYLKPGASTGGGTPGSVYLKDATGASSIVVSSATIVLASAGTAEFVASTTLSLTAGTGISFDGDASGVSVSGGQLLGFETGTGTVAGLSVTINSMTGVIERPAATLAAGAEETIALTNSRIGAATDVLVVTVASNCPDGQVIVLGALPAAGAASIIVYNSGGAACAGAYKIAFTVFRGTV